MTFTYKITKDANRDNPKVEQIIATFGELPISVEAPHVRAADDRFRRDFSLNPHGKDIKLCL